jgi:excisionase family DNA binding protein
MTGADRATRPTSPRLPKLINVPAAAEALGVSEKTVRRLIDTKSLRIYRIGRRVLIAEDDLAAYLAQARKI